MPVLNFQNVEKLIFHNEEINFNLPRELHNYVYTWQMARKASFLRQTAKKAVFDFLNALTEEHLDLLSELFEEPTSVEKIDYKTVRNYKIPISKFDICEKLCEIEGYNYFTTWRDSDYLYISMWR